MILLIWGLKDPTLITIGDAAASFLGSPTRKLKELVFIPRMILRNGIPRHQMGGLPKFGKKENIPGIRQQARKHGDFAL